MQDMICPNGWVECNECLHLQKCIAGMYEPEEDEEPIVKTAKIVEKIMHNEAIKSTESIKGTVVEKFSKLEGDTWWREFGKRRASDLHVKEALPLLGGVTHGGGSKSKNHKKPQKKMPEYLKTFGQ